MALLPDLDTRTVLNVVEENFERVGLKTYAIRMIYTGEHTLNKEAVINLLQENINSVNSSYCDINVRGLFLAYDSYFVHVVEGSEDTVFRHLRFLFESERKWIDEKTKEEESNETTAVAANTLEDTTDKPKRVIFKRAKMLTLYHSIQTFMFEEWRALTARPPSLVGKLNVHGPMSEHLEQLRICLDKIKRITVYAQADEDLSFEGLSAVDPQVEALPEVALIDYLLQSQYLLDLRHAARVHRRVDDYAFYFERVWPLPLHFTPRHLYKLKIDDSFVEPLPVMPWELVKKEVVEDEEREENQSASDSSD